MEYTTYRLGEVCKIFGRIGFRGYTTKDLVDSPKDGAISLSPSNIVNGVLDLSSCTYLSWKKYEESPEIKIESNDIIIVKTGNSYGRTAIIRDVVHPMTLNPQFVVLKNCVINPVYLSYFIRTNEFQKQIYGIVGGSAIPTLSQEALANLLIRVPQVNIQSKIVDILDSLDRKIALNRKANEVLESMAKQLYDYWFVQFDFPNDEGKPYKSSGGKMVYNETLKREIPEGWEVKQLSEIGTFKNGINYDPNEPGSAEYRIVNVRNVSSTSLLIDSSDLDVLLLDESKASTYLIKEGDILITRSGNPGATRSYCECDIPAVYCGFIICFSPSFAIHRKYLLMFLKDREIITSRLKGGSIMPNISQDALKPVLVPIPDTDVLKRFEESIVPIISKLQANISEIKHLTSLRDYLLPLLMNGQVKVS